MFSVHLNVAFITIWLLFDPLIAVVCLAEDSLFEKSLYLPQNLNSYEFSCLEQDLSVKELQGISVDELYPEVATHFYQSGDMYRVNINLGSAAEVGDTPYEIMAYNGEHFQNFSAELDTLSFSGSNRFPDPYLQTNPLIVLFVWVEGKPGVKWHELRDPLHWRLRDSIKKSDLLQDVNGFECEVFEVSSKEPINVTWSVYVAKDANFLPVRVVGKSNETREQHQIDVTKTVTVSSSGQRMICPVSIRLSDDDPSRSFTRILSFEIDPESWRVNHSIPLDTFTISPSIARNVDDFDTNFAKHAANFAKQPNTSKTKVVSSSSSWFLRCLVFINIVAIIIVLFVMRLKQKNS